MISFLLLSYYSLFEKKLNLTKILTTLVLDYLIIVLVTLFFRIVQP
jgi:hypothetical protein